MISVQTIQVLITGGVVGSVAGFLGAIPYLKKKGININVEEKLTTVEKALDAVEPILNVAKEVVPGNKIVNIVDVIEHWTRLGVKNAEQLYHASKLTNDDRKAAAKETVYTVLKEFNIIPTENQEKLIEDTLQAAVGDLGHKDKSDAEKEAEKKALQAQVTQLTTENTNFKNAITAAANTMQVVTQTTPSTVQLTTAAQ